MRGRRAHLRPKRRPTATGAQDHPATGPRRGHLLPGDGPGLALVPRDFGGRAPARAGEDRGGSLLPLGIRRPRSGPIPGRALVRRVLSRPDEHSRWFRERVEALRLYREATPLAEELLGIALGASARHDASSPLSGAIAAETPGWLSGASPPTFAQSAVRCWMGTWWRSFTGRRWLVVAVRCTNWPPIAKSRSFPCCPEPTSDARNGVPTEMSSLHDASVWWPRTLKESRPSHCKSRTYPYRNRGSRSLSTTWIRSLTQLNDWLTSGAC